MKKGRLSVVVGGQYGSESKGKVVSYLADETDLCVRVGAPNAGHTVVVGDTAYKLRQVPAAFINPKCQLAICAGALIDEEVLREEVAMTGSEKRLTIDAMAGIIRKEYAASEVSLVENIGSVGIGCGIAQVKRLEREEFSFAKDVLGDLRIDSVAGMINTYYDQGKRILIEGTQGFGLSVLHGQYPFVTSRDTTASAYLSEAGVSPRLADEIILVIRTYPIRVSGNSGPLEGEITWDLLSRRIGREVSEQTTVSKQQRRIGEFDLGLVKNAIMVNRPTQIALQFLNYLFPEDEGKDNWKSLSKEAKKYIQELEKELSVPITLIGTGADIKAMVDRR